MVAPIFDIACDMSRTFFLYFFSTVHLSNHFDYMIRWEFSNLNLKPCGRIRSYSDSASTPRCGKVRRADVRLNPQIGVCGFEFKLFDLDACPTTWWWVRIQLLIDLLSLQCGSDACDRSQCFEFSAFSIVHCVCRQGVCMYWHRVWLVTICCLILFITCVYIY